MMREPVKFQWDFRVQIIGQGYELAMSVTRASLLEALKQPDIDYVEFWAEGRFIKRYYKMAFARNFAYYVPSQYVTCKVYKLGRTHS